MRLGALTTASQHVVHREADGVLVLEPATGLSVTEIKLLENSALVTAIQNSREHPEKMMERDRTGSPRANGPEQP